MPLLFLWRGALGAGPEVGGGEEGEILVYKDGAPEVGRAVEWRQTGARAGDMTADYDLLLWDLVLADDPAEIARLEERAEATQAEAVDYFIERSAWGVDVGAFTGGKGSPAARRAALRAALRAARPGTRAR